MIREMEKGYFIMTTEVITKGIGRKTECTEMVDIFIQMED
jgi:hypothetical protein